LHKAPEPELSPEYTFVVNPLAGHGKGRKIAHTLEGELRRRGVRYEICETLKPGDATHLALRATGDVVVSVGGDGTVNEILNGMLGTGKRLGVIPAGSGNDFIKSVRIPADPFQALESILSRRLLTIDVGVIYLGSSPSNSGRFFCNGVGIGFDAEVAARTAAVTRIHGMGVYLIAVLRTLGTYSPPLFHMTVDGTQLSGRKLLIATGNGPCAGGGFYLTPKASVTDGLLDVCAIDAMGTLSILRLMPSVMRGKHLDLASVWYVQGRKIHVRADAPFSVHADGEMVARNTTSEVRIEVVAGAVEIQGAGA